ncbi:hypothetical protein CC78DRAFT_534675 [Lojkania enalia]|uniref:TOM core complex subunit Tom6 n=1 Tax=Lojkania enalia TaxID=147567 RepID=A0A9P4K4V8_9PLEO|nr:hypothetical protein CC78DRAFT_534675 [Didymosphaeria enalia]
MPPKTVRSSRAPEPSYARDTLSVFTNQENRSIVTAIGLFAVGVAFLHSSWSEILLPA